MRLYLDLSMGAAGDMFMSALYDLLPDKDAFRRKMDELPLPGVSFEYSVTEKCGLSGTHITVKVNGQAEQSVDVHSHDHEHEHSHEHGGKPHKHGKNPRGGHSHSGKRYHYTEIRALIRKLGLPDNVMADALGVYKILGEAEAAVHGVSTDELHLHEVGALDAVADVVGGCLLVNMLNITDIIASPVHVGSGQIRCEHGILPVPAPATAEILRGVPIYGGMIRGELCTPTGAAILKHFVSRFGEMPVMTVSKIGIGTGMKDFEAANVLRAFLCEDDCFDENSSGTIFELSCNLDDMTPEALGAAFEILLENGALDVFATPIHMKKNRPAVMLTCLSDSEKRGELSRLMLRHTTTLGVRVTACRRDVMSRRTETVATKYGDIRVKYARGFGVEKQKPEYDDVLAAAQRHGVPFMQVHDAVVKEEK